VSGHYGGAHPLLNGKETAHGLRAMDVGVLTTLGTFASIDWRKMMVINLDWLSTIRELLRMSSLKEGAVGE
jgi:hypothetical protein